MTSGCPARSLQRRVGGRKRNERCGSASAASGRSRASCRCYDDCPDLRCQLLLASSPSEAGIIIAWEGVLQGACCAPAHGCCCGLVAPPIDCRTTGHYLWRPVRHSWHGAAGARGVNKSKIIKQLCLDDFFTILYELFNPVRRRFSTGGEQGTGEPAAKPTTAVHESPGGRVELDEHNILNGASSCLHAAHKSDAAPEPRPCASPPRRQRCTTS